MLTHGSFSVEGFGGPHHSGTQPEICPHSPWGGGRSLPLATAFTDVGLLPRVHSLMLNELCIFSEAFPTLAAAMRLFPSVYTLMLPKLGAAPEALPAHIALIRLLSSVNSLMLNQFWAQVVSLIIRLITTSVACSSLHSWTASFVEFLGIMVSLFKWCFWKSEPLTLSPRLLGQFSDQTLESKLSPKPGICLWMRFEYSQS